MKKIKQSLELSQGLKDPKYLVEVTQVESLNLLVETIQRDVIEHLKTTRSELVFDREIEWTILRRLVQIGVSVIQNPNAPDGLLGNLLRDESLNYHALSTMLKLRGPKVIDSAFFMALVKELPLVRPVIKVLGKFKLVEGKEVPIGITDIIDNLLSDSVILSANSADKYQPLSTSDVKNANDYAEMFGRLSTFIGMASPPSVSPDVKVGMHRNFDIIEQALEVLRDPTAAINFNNTEGKSRPIDYITLAYAYAAYRHYTESEANYSALATARMDAGLGKSTLDVAARACEEYSWWFMTMYMAPYRTINKLNLFIMEDFWKLIKSLPFEDADLKTSIEAIMSHLSNENFVGGPQPVDTLGDKILDAIKASSPTPKDSTYFVTKNALATLGISFSLQPRPADVPNGFNGLVGWLPERQTINVFEIQEALLRKFLIGAQLLREQFADVHAYYRACAGVTTLEGYAFFNIPKEIMEIHPQLSWSASEEALPVRSLSKPAYGSVLLPKYANGKLLWEDKLYRPIFWEAFVNEKADSEYNVIRNYWPSAPSIRLLDPWAYRFMRGYIPFCYVDDTMASAGSMGNSEIGDMMRQLGVKSKTHVAYLDYIAQSLANEKDQSFVAGCISSMFSVYGIPDEELASITRTTLKKIPSSAALILPSIPVVYGLPFKMFLDAQSSDLTSRYTKIVTVINSKGANTHFLFIMHDTFPAPAPMVYVPFYIERTSWMPIPVNKAVYNHLISNAIALAEGGKSGSFSKMDEAAALWNAVISSNLTFEEWRLATADVFKEAIHHLAALDALAIRLRSMDLDLCNGTVNTSGGTVTLVFKSLNGHTILMKRGGGFSRISAMLPHVTFKGYAPTQSGISWNSIKNWSWLTVGLSNVGLGFIAAESMQRDSMVMFTEEDQLQAYNEDLDSVVSFVDLDNGARLVTEVSDQPKLPNQGLTSGIPTGDPTPTEPDPSQPDPMVGDTPPAAPEPAPKPAPTPPIHDQPQASEPKVDPIVEIPPAVSDKDDEPKVED